MKSELLKGALKHAYEENTNTRKMDIQTWVANIAGAISQRNSTSLSVNLAIISNFLKSIDDYEKKVVNKKKTEVQISESLRNDITLYQKGRKSMKEICDRHGISQDTFYTII